MHNPQGPPWALFNEYPLAAFSGVLPDEQAKQSKAKQSKAKQSKAKQSNAMQCKAMQCNAMQCNAMQCNAKQSKAKQSKAKQSRQASKQMYPPPDRLPGAFREAWGRGASSIHAESHNSRRVSGGLWHIQPTASSQ